MLPITVSVNLATAASATRIAAAQTLSGAGDFNLNGSGVVSGVALLNAPRRVLFTFAADETGHTFTVYGVSHNGQSISEAVAGTGIGTIYTNNDFLTVTRVASSAATTGNVSIGTNGVGSSRWVYLSPHMTPTNVRIACLVTPTVNYTVQYAYQDPAGDPAAFPIAPVTPTPFDDGLLTGVTASEVTTVTDGPPVCWRVTVNSGTGTVQAIGTQAGISGP